MCVIIASTEKRVTLEILEKCEEANPHGGGISWHDEALGKIVWKKGIEAKEIFNIAELVGPPYVIHFRISTIGGKIPQLCHPFPITRDCSTDLEGSSDSVMYHNGHWNSWDDCCRDMILRTGRAFPGGSWSDSRAMAWLAANSHYSFLSLIGQKVAIHTPKKIQLYGSFDEKDDICYSNLNWDRKVYSTSQWQGGIGRGYFNYGQSDGLYGAAGVNEQEPSK
jgi:hypothetical protein